MDRIKKFLIVGCGNMGGAMLAGWLAAGEDPERFAVLDPAIESVPIGVKLYREQPLDSDHDAVMLGFKPQQFGALAPGLQTLATGEVVVYSLLAGVTLERLREGLPVAAAHVRVMPNLAARIGKSPVILAESGLSSAQREEAGAFFDQLGSAEWLDDETKFDLVTALAGSGPGFVYRFIDALAAAAARLGLDRSQADALALQMVEGASALAAASEDPPGSLADRVASPGGMTREGLNMLDSNNALQELLVQTLRATAERGAELSQNTGK